MNSVRIGVDVAGIGRPLSTRAHRRCNSFQKAMCNTCDNRVEIHSTSEVLRDSGRVALKKSIGLCHVADGLSGANFKVHEFFSHLDEMQDFSRKVRYLFVTRNRTARAEATTYGRQTKVA